MVAQGLLKAFFYFLYGFWSWISKFEGDRPYKVPFTVYRRGLAWRITSLRQCFTSKEQESQVYEELSVIRIDVHP